MLHYMQLHKMYVIHYINVVYVQFQKRVKNKIMLSRLYQSMYVYIVRNYGGLKFHLTIDRSTRVCVL
jgi:hypothetical protein